MKIKDAKIITEETVKEKTTEKNVNNDCACENHGDCACANA